MKIRELIALTVYIVAGFACEKTKNGSIQSTQNNLQSILDSSSIHFEGWIESSPVNVYAVGLEDSGSVYNLKYWKNGVGILLPNHYSEAHSNFPAPATTGITVSGGDIYVCGRDFDPVTNTFVAAYWKNGQEIMLNSNSRNSWSSSIAVSGNDVYVAGLEQFSFNLVATWWKNGIPVTADTSISSSANAIAVLGNDVYVSGFEFQGTHNVALYWKNGSPVYLGDSSIDASTSRICISGGDVYIAGYQQIHAPTFSETAEYWKNGNAVMLTSGYPNGISVSGTDVYVVGTQPMGPAMFWKNNEVNPLPYTNAICISVSGTDVYIGGSLNDQPAIWKNGVLSSSAAQGEIVSICLSDK
jgi:hypothetical protein